MIDYLGILFETGTRLLCLLYADGTALLATYASDLQKTLDTFYEYCNKWRPSVNGKTTKILSINGNANDYRTQLMFGNCARKC